MMKKINVASLKKRKNQEKITMITAYDALFARLFDGGVDMILVGDSLAMSFGGEVDTLAISFEAMLYHTKAVCRATQESLVVFDMPFGSYITEEVALQNAIRVYKESAAEAIKLEGGKECAGIIKRLTQSGIAVMGHIGLKPQFVRAEGGYKIKGKEESELQALLEDAKALEESGVFALVLEGVKAEVAREITKSVSVPVIGIGSGAEVDGQVLVWSDMFGFYEAFQPKFVRRYLEGAKLIREGLARYVDDVKAGRFPRESESY